MKNLSRNEKLLGSVILVQAALLLAMFSGIGAPRSAHADIQISNPSERQIEMIDELRGINGRLDKVLAVLQNGEMSVKLAKAEEAKPDDPGK